MKRIASFAAGVALIAAACGTGETVSVAESITTVTTEPTGTTAPIATTTAPLETTTTGGSAAESAEGEAHIDEMAHLSGEGAAHDEGETVGEQEAGGAHRVVEIAMTELEFNPDRLDVTAGETIRFEVTNTGAIVHEFRLSNAHRIEEHIAGGHEGHGDDAGGHHGEVDVVLELESGESGELTVTFPEDTTLFTEVACLIPGHYEGGMKAPIRYT